MPFLIASTINYAQTGDTRVLCPSLDTLHEHADSIEDAQLDPDGSYNAYSLRPIIDMEHKFVWIVLAVNYIPAKSNEEAIKMGQKIVRDADTQVYKYPYKVIWMGSKMYYCGYGDNIFLFGGSPDVLPSSLKKFS